MSERILSKLLHEFKKHELRVVFIGGILVVLAVLASVVGVVYYKNRVATLDFRRGFNLEAPHSEDCFLVADKPDTQMTGSIYFLPPQTPRSDYQLMQFDCETWRLETLFELPDEFDQKDPALTSIDPQGERFWFIATSSEGFMKRFYCFDRSTGEWRDYEDPSGQEIHYSVVEFDGNVYFTVGDFDENGIRLNRLNLTSGHITEDCFHSLRSDLETGPGGLQVALSKSGKRSLYFSFFTKTQDYPITDRRIFRLDSAEALPVSVDSYPPGLLLGSGNRYPYTGQVTGFPQEKGAYYELWLGTVSESEWIAKSPTESLGFTEIDIDLDSLTDRKKLLNIPMSEELFTTILFFSPDGQFVLFEQACQSPIEAQGLIAVNIETGEQVPILAHIPHGYFGFLWLAWQ